MLIDVLCSKISIIIPRFWYFLKRPFSRLIFGGVFQEVEVLP